MQLSNVAHRVGAVALMIAIVLAIPGCGKSNEQQAAEEQARQKAIALAVDEQQRAERESRQAAIAAAQKAFDDQQKAGDQGEETAQTIVDGRAAPPESPPPESLLQKTLLASFKERLKDPDSAQFKNIQEGKHSLNCGAVDAICGEVNAKDGFGRYEGFSKFVIYLPQCGRKPGEPSTPVVMFTGDRGGAKELTPMNKTIVAEAAANIGC
jgi:hypothetical protein